MHSPTIWDRGECCPAQPRVLVGKGDLRLMFCMHHFNKYEVALLAGGWEIIIKDDSGLKDKVVAEAR